MEKKELSFEEAITKLEEIVKKLEAGTCPLDDAINLYTEGMSLAKIAGDKLDSATDKVNKILADNGELKDFELESN